MSLGYSIGDVIAIASLIERIVLEVKSYRAAPLHFQRLAVELDFLGQVCNQVFDLRPSLPDDLAHIERIRAIALQCIAPLHAFEEKMKGYENSLGANVGSYDPTLGGFRKRKRFADKMAAFKDRLHWSLMTRNEVDELRAIVTSEILAINTLLTMHEWSSSKNQRISNQAFASQLKKLIDTTSTASMEIKKFLVDAKAASERLEELIKSGNLTQAEQVRILTTIENKSTETERIVRELSKWHKRYSAGIREAVDKAQIQSVKLFSLKEYMEEWIRKIIQYCKEITGMIQRNTDILLSLHRMLAKFELLLKANINLPSIVFENVFGIKMLLPFQMCDTWESFSRLLRVMFYNKPGLQLVTAGRFLVMYSENNRIITPQVWSTSIAPDDRLSMSMILETVRPRACPRCQTILSDRLTLACNAITCLNCGLWLSSTDTGQLGAVSANAIGHPIPQPPLETIRLQNSSWNGQWTSSYIREQSTQRLAKLRRQSLRYNSAGAMRPATQEVMSFRRVHVVPYQGDILKALIEPGVKLRELMIEMSTYSPQDHDGTLPLEQKFIDILTDFNELMKTNVWPLFELRKRAALNRASLSVTLETWINKTSLILRNAPFKAHESQIKSICSWLERPPNSTTALYTTNAKGPKLVECQRLFDHYHDLLTRPQRSYNKEEYTQIPSPSRPVYDKGFFALGGLHRVNYEDIANTQSHLSDDEFDGDPSVENE